MATNCVAYFIMVHHKPYQFEWLMRAIYTPDDLFIVHVDLKSRLGISKDRRGLMAEVHRICENRSNIVIMRSRVTNWGGWSLSQALIDAVGQALSHSITWSHFVNLSGQCYPLKPINELKAKITALSDRLHVELRPIATLPADDWHHRWSPMFETPLRAFRLPGRRRPPTNFTMEYKGSQWVILPRAFCKWIVTAPLTHRVSAYLRRLLLSDELLVQTLAANSPWCDRIAPSYGRAIFWPGPRLVNIDDLPQLLQSEAWFARKFDARIDIDILRALAREGGFEPGPIPHADHTVRR